MNLRQPRVYFNFFKASKQQKNNVYFFRISKQFFFLLIIHYIFDFNSFMQLSRNILLYDE